MARDAVPSQYERRRQATERRLREALERLQVDGGRLSVARLAREAKVARNAIYTNHIGIIKALEQVKQHRELRTPVRGTSLLAQQRAEIEALKEERRLLVTENAALMKRALDSEAAAARHARRNAELIQAENVTDLTHRRQGAELAIPQGHGVRRR
jgi:hypothetical protein